MARARKTRNPKRRRLDRRTREALREYCALVDQPPAEADATGQGSAMPAATATPPSDKDAPGPETAFTADQKTSPSEPKKRCKHRKLPDRHYYHRPGKIERQYLGLQRRLTSVIDEKIAQGSTALEQWKRDAGTFMTKFKRKVKMEMEEMEDDRRRMRNNHNLRLESHQRLIENQLKRLVRVEKKIDDLSAKLGE
ncbi:hypothetical protein N0V84_000478 [Fusarium piperis]|uniref:Uncharacterized protein n=1 Tax=Fusarium piperis TaxID=1435070 RepID=A0A9W9BU02_9HYPO|nr:hypothetical protein N0V84_000478 [Fusarium piperis]